MKIDKKEKACENELEYNIVSFEGKQIYAFKIPISNSRKQFLNNIRKIYSLLKYKKLLRKMMDIGLYGITNYNSEENQIYYVGCEHEFENTEIINILPGKYAVFNCNGNDQKDIAPLVEKIYSNNELVSNLKIDKSYCFEKYIDKTCLLHIKINDNNY